MKKIQYKLSDYEIELFFPHERIKTKVQVLIILLETIRFMLYNKPIDSNEGAKIILYVKKMSRLIFVSDNKYYSINFPFNYFADEDTVIINFKNLINLDSKTISDLLSIIKDERFNSSSSLDFVEPVCDLESQYENNLWVLLKELLMMEDGYLRFDKDVDGYLKAKEQGKEHTHPENHIDVFYSNNNTFKVGLEKTIIEAVFLDYLDNQTDCMYLKTYR